MALATTADYEALAGQTLDDAETARVTLLLDAASEAVLAGANGQLIIEDTYTDVTIYNRDGRFWFPQRPVTDVASVEVDGVTLTEDDDYRWTSGGNGRPALLIRRVDGRDSQWTYPEAVVTYTAGWATVPWPIRAAVVATVKQVYQASAATPQTQVTPSGAFGTTYPQTNLDTLPMRLLPSTRKVINEWTKVAAGQSVESFR